MNNKEEDMRCKAESSDGWRCKLEQHDDKTPHDFISPGPSKTAFRSGRSDTKPSP